MQEAFEKNVQTTMEDFRLTPSASVWKDIELALHKTEKKRLPFWWWFAAAILLIVLCTTYFVLQPNASSLPQRKANHVHNNKQYEIHNNANNNTGTTNNNPSIKTTKTPQLISVDRSTTTAFGKSKHTQETIKRALPTKSLYTIGLSDAGTNAKVTMNDVEDQTIISANLHQENMVVRENMPQWRKEVLADIMLLPLLSLPTFIQPKIASGDAQLAPNYIHKKRTTKKWFAIGGIGRLATTAVPWLQDHSANDAVQSSLSNNPTPSLSNSHAELGYNVGIAFRLGIGFEKSIANKWSYTLGLQYQYYTSQLSVTKDSTVTYILDQSNGHRYTNAAHWLSLPVHLRYQMNKQHHKPLYLLMGTTLSVALHNDWLIAQKAGNNYLANTQKNNPWMLQAATGVAWQAWKNTQIQCFLEQSLTPLHKQVDRKYYFSTIHLNIQQNLLPLRSTKKTFTHF